MSFKRIIRMLVYEGDEEFVKMSLKQRIVRGEMIAGRKNRIKEYFLSQPMPFDSDPPNLFEPEKIMKEEKETKR